MDDVTGILLGFAGVSYLWGMVSAFMIASALHRRGIRIGWNWDLFFVQLENLFKYGDITRKETGRKGWLFYSQAISMSLAVVAGFLAITLWCFDLA